MVCSIRFSIFSGHQHVVSTQLLGKSQFNAILCNSWQHLYVGIGNLDMELGLRYGVWSNYQASKNMN